MLLCKPAFCHTPFVVDDYMNSLTGLPSVVAVCLFFCCLSAAAQTPKPDRTFTEWDKDKNGKLSREELPEGARRNFDRADTNRDGFISPAEHSRFLKRNRGNRNSVGRKVSGNIDLKTDLPYASTDNPRQKLDLAMPKKRLSDDLLPVVAFIHGGGWRKGDKRSGIPRVSRFVESGRFAGVSIGYRLSTEAKWPAQIHDCKAAIRWLKANADQYGIDPKRICVFGTSAGGHLVAMLGVTGGVKELEGNLGQHTDQDSRVAAVVDFFGPADFLTMNDFPGKLDHNAEDSPESLLIGGAIQSHKDRARAAAPMMYVTEDDAPILIMHGTKDPLVPFDQSVKFHRALLGAEVNAILVPVTDGGHGFGGHQVDERVSQFVDKYLLGKELTVSAEPIGSAR